MTNRVVVSFLYSQFMMHHFGTFEHEPRKALKINVDVTRLLSGEFSSK